MTDNFSLRNSLNKGSECWTLYEAHRRRGEKAKISSLKGWRLSVTLPYIRKALHTTEKQREPSSRKADDGPVNISEESGVRLALAFLGIRHLHKLERAEKLCQEVQSMSREEAYYWYSKVRSPKGHSPGIRALRTLLCG